MVNDCNYPDSAINQAFYNANYQKRFFLNCQIFNKDIFQKYLEIKMLFFHKNNIKTYFCY